jgi:predicted aspartyl protease
MPSFTIQLPSLWATGPVVELALVVDEALEKHLRANNLPVPAPVVTHAMIDTGATGTVISPSIPKQLNLSPVGVTSINTASHANVRCYQYPLRILFPRNVVAETLAIAAPLQGQNIQCLIGRDLLRHGVLTYIGYANQFTLSF